MDLRHMDALIAIAEEGTFTAAADVLSTTQSNVSAQIRQLETELGVELLARGRHGAVPTESGRVVLDRARRIRREIEAMRVDVASVQGLEVGEASFGVVGTASRWIAPALVGALHSIAPGVRFHITEAPSERLAELVIAHECAQAIVTESVTDHRLVSEHLLDEALVGLAPATFDVGAEPVSLARLARWPLVLPAVGNPFRQELETAAAVAGVELTNPVELDGVRLIVDIVGDGNGVTVLPATAVPPAASNVRMFRIADLPRRRLALITARDMQLSLADQAVRRCLEALVTEHLAQEAAAARA